MLVQLLEQVIHRSRRKLLILVRIEPDALAGVADVEFERPAAVVRKGMHVHRDAAGRAIRFRAHVRIDRRAVERSACLRAAQRTASIVFSGIGG